MKSLRNGIEEEVIQGKANRFFTNNHSKNKQGNKTNAGKKIRDVRQYTIDVLRKLVDENVIPEEIGSSDYRKFKFVRVKTDHEGKLLMDWYGNDGVPSTFDLENICSATSTQVMTLMDVHYSQRQHSRSISEKRRGNTSKRRITTSEKRNIGLGLVLSLEEGVISEISEIEKRLIDNITKVKHFLSGYNSYIDSVNEKGMNHDNKRKINFNFGDLNSGKNIINKLIFLKKYISNIIRVLKKVKESKKVSIILLDLKTDYKYLVRILSDIDKMYHFNKEHSTNQYISGGELASLNGGYKTSSETTELGLSDDELEQHELEWIEGVEKQERYRRDNNEYLRSLKKQSIKDEYDNPEIEAVKYKNTYKKNEFKKHYDTIRYIISRIETLCMSNAYSNKPLFEETKKTLVRIKAIYEEQIYDYGDYSENNDEFDIGKMIGIYYEFVEYAEKTFVESGNGTESYFYRRLRNIIDDTIYDFENNEE